MKSWSAKIQSPSDIRFRRQTLRLDLQIQVRHPPLPPRARVSVIDCVRGVISPLLANLFLHYAFDLWMLRRWKHLPFERYADDVIVHCRAEWEANMVRAGIEARLKECGLQLHPEKTKLGLLQGCQSAGELPKRAVRLSWVYVSAQAGDQPQGKGLLQRQPRHLE